MENPQNNMAIRSSPFPQVVLLPYCLAIIVGIILARFAKIPLSFAVYLGQIAFLAAGILLLWAARAGPHPWIQITIRAALMVGFTALGQIRYDQTTFFPSGSIYRYGRPGQSRLATIKGRICTSPEIRQVNGEFSRFDYIHKPQTHFILDCSQVLTYQGWRPIHGRVYAAVGEPAPNLALGQYVKAYSTISLPGPQQNPGDRLASNSVQHYPFVMFCRIKYSESVTILSSPFPSSTLTAALDTISSAVQTAVWDGSNSGSSADTLLSALLIGKRSALPASVNEAFMRTGTAHYLSLSGLHVGIIGWLVWTLLTPFSHARSVRGWSAIAFIFLYLCIVPHRAPVLRASIVFICLCLGYMTRREGNPLNLLVFSAIVILLCVPADLFNPGFQLSYIVVIALICFVPAILNWRSFRQSAQSIEIILPPEDHYQVLPWWQDGFIILRRRIYELFVVSTVAWLAGLLLTAFYFNRLSPWGIINSMLLFVCIAAILLLGMLKVFLILIYGTAGPIADLLEMTADLTIKLVTELARLPGSGYYVRSPSPFWIWLFYILLAAAACFTLRKIRPPVWLRWTLVLVFFLWPLTSFVHSFHSPSRWTCLSVGHGCANVIELASGQTVIVDAGSMGNLNVGRKVIAPYLRSRGINRILALFLSHPDQDHINGVLDICQLFHVDIVCLGPGFRSKDNSVARFVIQRLNHLGQNFQIIDTSTRLAYMPQIKIVWPPPELPDHILDNDTSLVLRVDLGGWPILLTGDIGNWAQTRMLETLPPRQLQARVVQLPHHGALTPSLRPFIQKVSPNCCFNSCGRRKSTQFQALADELSGYPLRHTRQEGALSLIVDAQGHGKIESFCLEAN